MGFWEYVQWATDGLRQYPPAPDYFKDACQASYGHIASATSTIAVSAAVGGQKACNLAQSAAAATSTIAASAAVGGQKACNPAQSAATDAARLGASGVSVVRSPCSHAWNYAWWAAGQADRAVRIDAPRWIGERMPEAEQRQQMLQVLKEVGVSAADIAISESARCVPGGPPLYRVIKKGASEIAKIQREGSSKSPYPDHIDGGAGSGSASASIMELSPPPSTAGVQKPEEVIGLFLREGFKGRDFLDALIVPVPRGERVDCSPAGASNSTT